jgi:hypothetical protein
LAGARRRCAAEVEALNADLRSRRRAGLFSSLRNLKVAQENPGHGKSMAYPLQELLAK